MRLLFGLFGWLLAWAPLGSFAEGDSAQSPAGAKATIEQFWSIQNGRDYTKLVPLFADDAVFVDPSIGVVRGKDAIASLFAQITEDLAEQGAHFDVLEIAGDEHVAWSRWVWRRPDGDVEGVGLYRVENGKLTYYRDFYFLPADRE
ncbi:MAG: nuclear transport factor 2 family protein [Pseudomonadota bacterium]